MIELNEEVKLATSQTYVITGVEIHFEHLNNYATIRYDVLNETGAIIFNNQVYFNSQEYNDFWTRFTSGTSLYEMILEKLNIKAEPTKDTEKEFTN